MTLASNSSDQKKKAAEKGVRMPRITTGMVKLPPMDLQTKKHDDKSEADTSAKKDDADDASLIDEAKKHFIQARTNEDINRKAGLDDLKFLDGEQWDPADAASRAAEGRPCITENRLPTFANQIKNDQRQNRPSIVISPMGDKSSKKDAKTLRGMIRAIERDSSADVAYDTGFAGAVDNGWGYWRIKTEYEYDDSFDKVLVVMPIFNPFTVYLDPNRTPHGLDSKWGIITEMMINEEFDNEYPHAHRTPWGETGIGESEKDWVTKDEVRVAEYYYFEEEVRTLVHLDNDHRGWKDELNEKVLNDIAAGRIEIVQSRDVVVKRLKWLKMTSIEILERADCDGDYVPIIECIGTMINVNGKNKKKGIIRDAKGPQRMLDYYSTLEAENVALQPKAPYIMEEGQVEGHEEKWKSANRKSYSYLLYKGTSIGGRPAPPPQRQPFAGPPAAILAAKQGNVEALRAITGIRFDATMSEKMMDESGRAIRRLEQNVNLGAYHFIDNFARALRNTGIIFCNLIPVVYDTKRIVSILDESNSEDRVMINPNMAQAHAEVIGDTPDQKGARIKMFNPKVGRYKVTVTIGPSYATRRIEAMESMMEFAKAMPQAATVIADLIAKYSDWEGAEEIAGRLAKAIPPNMLAPNRDEMTPQTEALIMGLQTHIQKMTQQMQMMGKELQDRQADRDVALKGIEKKFEAEVLKVAEKMEEVAAKKDMHLQATLGRQLAEIAKAVQGFDQQLKQSAQSSVQSTQ